MDGRELIFKKRKQVLLIIILLTFFFLGTLIMIYGTRWGLGLSDDSYYYVAPAVDLSQGLGMNFSLHYPPLVSLILSVPTAWDIDPLVAFRWINIFLYGANCLIYCLIIFLVSKSNRAVVLGGLIYLSIGTIFEMQAWAMSEALYINLTLMGILWLGIWNLNKRVGWLLLSACSIGFSVVVRYIGVSGLLAGFMVVMFSGKRDRWKDPMIYLMSGAIPVVSMLLVYWQTQGAISDRIIANYGINLNLILQGASAFVMSILPGRFVNGHEMIWMLALIILFLLTGLISMHGMIRNKAILLPVQSIAIFSHLFMITYLLGMIISRSFFDPLIPFTGRLVGPMVMVALLGLFCVLKLRWAQFIRLIQLGVILITAGLILINGIRSYALIQSYHDYGRGYSSARDHISETYSYLRRYPDAIIYSNAPAALYFWIDKQTLPLPDVDQLADMRAKLQAAGGFVVIFNSIPLDLYHVTLDEVTEDMEVVIQLSEATIYRVSDN